MDGSILWFGFPKSSVLEAVMEFPLPLMRRAIHAVEGRARARCGAVQSCGLKGFPGGVDRRSPLSPSNPNPLELSPSLDERSLSRTPHTASSPIFGTHVSSTFGDLVYDAFCTQGRRRTLQRDVGRAEDDAAAR